MHTLSHLWEVSATAGRCAEASVYADVGIRTYTLECVCVCTHMYHIIWKH